MGSHVMGVYKVPEKLLYTSKALILLEAFFLPMEI